MRESTMESVNKLNYDSVMERIYTKVPGTSYKHFVDNFYTRPTLFRYLLQMRIWVAPSTATELFSQKPR